MSEQHVSATGGFAYGVVGADIHVFGDGTPLYVLYSGQLDVDAPQRSRSFAFVTRAHDLHHPGSLLRRSPARSGDAERAAVARAGGDDPGVRDLLRLANVMATRH